MNTTPEIIREKLMAEAVVEFLREVLPADAESISASFSSYTHAAGPYWSITGARWPSDSTARATGVTLPDVLDQWSKRPDEKAKRVAELEAELAVLKGQAVEVVA